MALIETYSKTDIQGRTYEYNLRQAENGSWFVDCWEIEKISEEEDSASHHWTTDGKVIGYRHGNPNFPIREPFTEETAREEFEKWRS